MTNKAIDLIIKAVEKRVLVEIKNRIAEDYRQFKESGRDTKGHFRCMMFVDEHAKELGVKI